jgi:NAD dependent epimerase/dehydratase family enzyme
MLLPFRLGLGSPLGSGRQWMPWIHRDDVVGLALLAAGSDSMRGAVNAVSPAQATNREFTKALGRALGRPTFLPPVPGFVLRVGMGQFADVLLASQRVLPVRAREAGYGYRQPELEAALRESVG